MSSKYLWFCAVTSLILFVVTVFILGLITPGYDHIHHTTSLLSIKKYGLIQQINFVQLGIGLLLTAFLVYQNFESSTTKVIWLRIVTFCLFFLLIITIFPADDTSDPAHPLSHHSLSGFIHLINLLIFFLLAPIGVYSLSKSISTESHFSSFSRVTCFIGYTATFLCYLWTYIFIAGIFHNYLGLLQKIIIILIFSWLVNLLMLIRNRVKYN